MKDHFFRDQQQTTPPKKRQTCESPWHGRPSSSDFSGSKNTCSSFLPKRYTLTEKRLERSRVEWTIKMILRENWQVTQLLTASYLARMCPHQLRHEKKRLDRLRPGDGKRRGTISGMRKTWVFWICKYELAFNQMVWEDLQT